MYLLWLLFSLWAFLAIPAEPVELVDVGLVPDTVFGVNLKEIIENQFLKVVPSKRIRPYKGSPAAAVSNYQNTGNLVKPDSLGANISPEEEKKIVSLNLQNRFRMSFARSVDFLLKAVSAKLSEFGSYRFKSDSGEVYLVKGLGNFTIANAEAIKIVESSEKGKVLIANNINVGPITFLADPSSDMPSELPRKEFNIGGHLVIAITEKNTKTPELKSLIIDDQVKETKPLTPQEKTLLNEFFSSLVRTNFRDSVMNIIQMVAQEKKTQQAFLVVL